MMNSPSPSPSGRRTVARGLLAGPVCFLTAFTVMAGASLWFPPGAAAINNIAVPIIVFPAIWAALFFYLMLDRKLGRAWAVTVLLLAVHGGFIARHVLAAQAAKKANTLVTEATAAHTPPTATTSQSVQGSDAGVTSGNTNLHGAQ